MQNREDFKKKYTLKRKWEYRYYTWDDLRDYLTPTQYNKFCMYLISKGKKQKRYGCLDFYVREYLEN